MAVTHAVQIIGNGGVIAEVEGASKALRITPKPDDVPQLYGGVYAFAGDGILSTNNVSNPTILADSIAIIWTWQNKANILARLQRITVSGSSGAVAGTAGVYTVDLRVARSAIVGTWLANGSSSFYPRPLRTLMGAQGDVMTTFDVGPTPQGPPIAYCTSPFSVASTSLLGTASSVWEKFAAAAVGRPATAGTTWLRPTTLWESNESDGHLDMDNWMSFACCISGPTFGQDTSTRANITLGLTYSEVPVNQP